MNSKPLPVVLFQSMMQYSESLGFGETTLQSTLGKTLSNSLHRLHHVLPHQRLEQSSTSFLVPRLDMTSPGKLWFYCLGDYSIRILLSTLGLEETPRVKKLTC